MRPNAQRLCILALVIAQPIQAIATPRDTQATTEIRLTDTERLRQISGAPLVLTDTISANTQALQAYTPPILAERDPAAKPYNPSLNEPGPDHSRKPPSVARKSNTRSPASPLTKHFQHYAKHYFGESADWQWFLAQAMVESELKSKAVSSAGAMGLMQIMPKTFKDIRAQNKRITSPFDPVSSIAAGIYYNRQLYDQWQSIRNEQERRRFMFASYNAGPTLVKRLAKKRGGVKSFSSIKSQLPAESRDYVAKIERQHRLLALMHKSYE